MAFNKKFAVALATGALVFNSLTTTAFAATIEVSGNGSDSENTVDLNVQKTNTIVQNNKANIDNNVKVDAKTGGNKASDNNGGDVEIDTGDSNVTVSILNQANRNWASLDCCISGDTDVVISDNGSDSDNKVDLDWNSKNGVYQDNKAYVDNDVDVDTNTGDNEAEDNNNGEVSIETGDSDVEVGVFNMLNLNLARIGGGDNEGGSLSLWIKGNAADSDNDIYADVDSSNVVKQNNKADVDNDVDVEAETGNNEAEDNNGGFVGIDTGDADVAVGVSNIANFNWADLSCGCLYEDLLAKIADNGADSDNKIDLDLENGEQDGVYQDNDADFDNDLKDLEANTGDNDAEDNNAGSGEDPSIETGDADLTAEAGNVANFNLAGLGVELDLDWDFADLLDMLGL